MKEYDHKKIEAKWQKIWEKAGIYKSRENAKKPKKYVLDMFPYPSGDGLHVGHPKGYIATDVFSRHARMQGHEVLHPMGWDAFGLPAENFAIKNKMHPRKAVERNIKRFKEQLKMIGLDYDWSREINTTDPDFYKWTQWIFLKLYEKGLAYESYEPINWCPTCQTGLSNEDLEGNACERCGTIVEKRPMRQWILKITDYAERLLEDLALLPQWQEHIKESQRNWIGKSEGAEIDFPLEFQTKDGPKPNYLILHGWYKESSSGAFIPWLKTTLMAKGFDVQAPDLPNPETPMEVEQVNKVLENCTINEHTIIIGHSLGGTVAMKVLEKINKPIAGLVLVAPAMNPSVPGAKSRPFWKTFDWNIDYKRIKRLAGFVAVLCDLQEGEPRVPYLRDIASKLEVSLTEGDARERHFFGREEPMILSAITAHLTVFTTRADTLYGAIYLVLSPEHPWITLAIDKNHDVLKNKEEVKKYVVKASKKTEIERQENKDKTGIKLEGIEAINPATREKIPVYVADYVLANYGTGAIMAVPAHDERDFEFAKKFDIPIKEVIEPLSIQMTDTDALRPDLPLEDRNGVAAVVKHWEKNEYLCLSWKQQPIRAFVTGGIEPQEDPIETAKREIEEETGYMSAELVKPLGGRVHAQFYTVAKGKNRFGHYIPLLFKLKDSTRQEVSEYEKNQHDATWVKADEVAKFINRGDMLEVWNRVKGEVVYTGKGILANSGEFDGLDNEQAKSKITEVFGRKKTTFKLRDWVFSRQRYWGEPIPIIHCGKCGIVPVPEKDLPVKLPDVKNYKPTGTGESPLAAIEKWVNVKCPKCKGKAKRETNTMPQWAGSSWYYLRYMDPENKKALVSAKKEKYWAPVDLYVGGAEHATRHLIYARFWHKFLFDIGLVTTLEPFTRLISVGLIQAEDGRKMSKRYGNVINPDDIVEKYGADTLRVYEMFMGPFTDAIAWNTNSMIGARRFLERVWRLQEKCRTSDVLHGDIEKLLHRTIKKVGEDIEAFKFNTAISSMMIFVNAAEKGGITTQQYGTFLKLLAPFAPHMAEDLWVASGEKKSVHISPWPLYDDAHLHDEIVTMVVQVGGKVRGQMQVSASIAEDEARSQAEKLVSKWLEGKRVVKVVFVPKRLINFVIAD